MPNMDEWRFILAPGVLPASEEALENFSGRRDEQYELVATEILETWPTLTYEPGPMKSEKASTPDTAPNYEPMPTRISFTTRDEPGEEIPF